MNRSLASAATLLLAVALAGVSAPASADHTNPREQLAPTQGLVAEGYAVGGGTWEHLAHFQGGAGPQLTGGGTDMEFFRTRKGSLWGAFGTLGQDTAGAVGQRFFQLTRKGKVTPRWRADHGSGHCEPASPSVTGLQHDTQVARHKRVTLISDTTDALGRCHDPEGGGIEIVDATRIGKPKWKPREVHLVRFPGFTHTNTVDGKRPWIVYSSSSDFADRNWIDVVDMRSCFGKRKWSTKKRRAECRPRVSRIHLRDNWTKQRDQSSGELEPGSATCHDITYRRNRLYCAAINATLILDVSGLTKPGGRVKGRALRCEVVDGTDTDAKVTTCGDGAQKKRNARGWKFLGTFQHPGRDCSPTDDIRTCNSNNFVPSAEGVAVSHEADPTHDRQFMFVTDERGGGIVAPGASCSPGIDNPYGNGGAHAFDISNPSNIRYAKTLTGENAVYISDAVVPAGTFCDIHVIEHVPGEQRFIAAYYTQGIKVVDYYVDKRGRLEFRERASYTLPDANTWTAEAFKVKRNEDGTRTYFLAVNDIHRGIDIVSWTGKPNRVGAPMPAKQGNMTDAGLLGGTVALLGGAMVYRRLRARAAR